MPRSLTTLSAVEAPVKLRSDPQPKKTTPIRRSDTPNNQDADKIFQLVVDTYAKCIASPEAANKDDLLVAAQLLDQVFELDFQALRDVHYDRAGARIGHNVTCMKPADEGVFPLHERGQPCPLAHYGANKFFSVSIITAYRYAWRRTMDTNQAMCLLILPIACLACPIWD